MKKIIIIVIAAMFYGLTQYNESKPFIKIPSNRLPATHQSQDLIKQAYLNRQNNFQVQSHGVIVKLLTDDNQGSRHQKFIIKISNDLTLLVAHNIDLAPRLNDLREGDRIEFYGVYEYNEKGGVIHWTHHDPAGRHTNGWLKHNGTLYQ